MAEPSFTVSIVSHGQVDLVHGFIEDLSRHCAAGLRVVLTRNVPEPAPALPGDWRHRLEVIDNDRPKGFGANHNAAFRRCDTRYFCVANPDIRLASDPFPALAAALELPRAGPLVRDPEGNSEDSARKFPTGGILLLKLLSPRRGPDYPIDQGLIDVDWVAGMFMAFRADAFRAADGFDERFFLYYEDVDICRRLRGGGYSVAYEPRAAVIHDARRASRRNPRLMAIHAASALRYLLRNYGRRPL